MNGKVSSFALFMFASRQMAFGLYPEAVVSARAAFALLDKDQVNKNDTYLLTLMAVNAMRTGSLNGDEIKASRGLLKQNEWPAPILRLLLGELTPEKLLQEAKSNYEARERQQLCDANFYIGEWYLAHGEKGLAAASLFKAVNGCWNGYLQRTITIEELKRLGVPLPQE